MDRPHPEDPTSVYLPKGNYSPRRFDKLQETSQDDVMSLPPVFREPQTMAMLRLPYLKKDRSS